MQGAAPKLHSLMTVAQFLEWPGDGTGTIYELVEGEVRAQDYASDAHGTIQSNLIRLIGNHFVANRPGCRIVTAPGIQPHLRANWNFRIPDLGVTCAPNRQDHRATPKPVLLIEILSPSNEADTWSNIPPYASIPTVEEILIVDSTRIAAELLRRGDAHDWPENPEPIAVDGVIEFKSIAFSLRLSDSYRDTYLEPAR